MNIRVKKLLMKNVMLRLLGTYLFAMINFLSYAQGQKVNHTPVVEILQPEALTAINWNTLIPYTIDVKDREDGYSAYEEIANGKVILLAKYLEEPSSVASYLARIEAHLEPLIVMSKSACLNCHAANSKLIGPSFDLIAEKYNSHKNAKTYLSEKVIKGGTGIWGEEKMPPQPNLSQEDVGLIVDWILLQKDDPTPFYVGLEGAIRMSAARNSKKGVFFLTAAYEDQGIDNIPESKQLGHQTIKLKIGQ